MENIESKMVIETTAVPKGIRYLSEWSEFRLPDKPTIIDKQVTGCGFTESVISSDENTVLIEPRLTLLWNKYMQHRRIIKDSEDRIVKKEIDFYYAKVSGEHEIGVDKDLEAVKPKTDKDENPFISYEDFRENLINAIQNFQLEGKPIKIGVTYDSFRKVREILEELKIIETFHFVVDEFQSIFTDARFKPNTEMEFVSALQGLEKVCYVSATPMMEDYLAKLPEFKDLPYIKLDWNLEEPGRVIIPQLTVKSCRSINTIAKNYITDHKNGVYDYRTLFDKEGNPIKVVEAKELVFYVNSVKNQCDIIRQNKLTFDDVCVLCADTIDNRKKIREAFRTVYKELDINTSLLPKEDQIISAVPTPNPETGEVINKPITLCTKTVYLGADFYSTCARSIVLSDASIECLAVDITLDLPQILGRQRLDENPWKNCAEVWVKYGTKSGEVTEEQFNQIVEEKRRMTEDLLLSYDSSPTDSSKNSLSKVFLDRAKTKNYKEDYVAVNRHSGSSLKPQLNMLVLISERRAFDIQRVDYKDRFSVMRTIEDVFGSESMNLEVQTLMEVIEMADYFNGKMDAICKYLQTKTEKEKQFLVPHLPEPFKTYYTSLGPEFITSVGCKKNKLEDAIKKRSTPIINSSDTLVQEIYSKVNIGDKKSKADWKCFLSDLYYDLGLSKSAKASDLENWFEIKSCKIPNPISGKRDMGFEIIKRLDV